MSGLIGIGLSGLNAALAGIRTTQHNISNANTAGFHRQEVGFTSLTPSYSGAGFYGNGVAVETVQRLYSQFLDNELLRSEGQLERYDVYSSYASQIDRMLGDRNTGLNSALSSFFAAVNEVANDPTSMSARQAMLSSAENLEGRVRNLGTYLENTQNSIDQEMDSIAAQVSVYARQIAGLNDKIAAMEAMNGQPANDLRDQRDQLTAEVNKLINVTAITQSDGSYNLYVGSGQPLVVGNRANSLTTVADSFDPNLKVPAIAIGNATLTLDSDLITGGRLAGLLSLRDEMVIPAQQDLGRIVIALADRFNTQHASGFDLSGTAGSDFFSPIGALIRAPLASSSNTGDEVISATLTNVNQLTSSEYQLVYNGAGSYTLTRMSDGASSTGAIGAVTTISGQAQGFTLAQDGSALTNAAAGDRWVIRLASAAPMKFVVLTTDPSEIAAAATAANAPGDNSNAIALASLQSTMTMGNGTATFQVAYNQMVNRTANLASEADISQKAYNTLTEQAMASQQSLSGVNLDEEAANLIRFQQAYQAAARAMQVSSSLFDSILSLGR